jgi:hypothetical protein
MAANISFPELPKVTAIVAFLRKLAILMSDIQNGSNLRAAASIIEILVDRVLAAEERLRAESIDSSAAQNSSELELEIARLKFEIATLEAKLAERTSHDLFSNFPTTRM